MGIIEDYKGQTKESRRMIVIMILLVIMFVIGIFIRWDYIKGEVKEGVNRYIEVFDTTKN